MVQVTAAVAIVELGLLGLIICQVCVFQCVGLFSLSCHGHKILENLAYTSGMISEVEDGKEDKFTPNHPIPVIQFQTYLVNKLVC